MTDQQTWTVLRLLEWTTDYLGQHGSESPRLDAEVLLAEARGCNRIDLYTAFDEVADEKTRVAFRELVRRRAEGTPVAYLVGRREFYSRMFRVTPDVLIPRPETEFILVTMLDLVRHSENKRELTIVDVGTGSGILAVCAACELPTAKVVAVDASPAALDVARANAANHQVEHRITFVEGDLLTPLPPEPSLDFVISNPPYVSELEYADLPVTVREYEPRPALVAGVTGTEIIARLVPAAAERLKVDGHLIVEISPMIEAKVSRLFEQEGRFSEVTILKDLDQHARVVRARRK